MNRMALLNILAEEGLVYKDEDGDALSSAEVSAIQSNDPERFAKALADRVGLLESALWTDYNLKLLRRMLSESGHENPTFQQQTIKALAATIRANSLAAIESSPWRRELKVIGNTFDENTPTPKDIKFLEYKTVRKKGVLGTRKVTLYAGVILEDPKDRLGVTRFGRHTLTEDSAKREGTTLRRVLQALDELGAKSVDKGKTVAWKDDANWP